MINELLTFGELFKACNDVNTDLLPLGSVFNQKLLNRVFNGSTPSLEHNTSFIRTHKSTPISLPNKFAILVLLATPLKTNHVPKPTLIIYWLQVRTFANPRFLVYSDF